MDKEQIREILSVYRPGLDDASDPYFAQAIHDMEREPELSAWFAALQRFDAEVKSSLERAPVPPELKDLILRRVTPSKVSAPRGFSLAPWLAMAAAVVAAFFLGRGSVVAPIRGSGSDLALQAISYSGESPKLDFVCFDSEAVRGWIEDKSAAMKLGRMIDKPMPNMKMIGSSVAHWDGKPVIMVALQNGERMGMLYLMKASDFPTGATEVGEVMERDGWASKVGRSGDRIFVLTTRGTRADLDFPMPL